MIFGLPYFAALMLLAASLYVGGRLVDYSVARNVGGVIFLAIAAMRLKKILFPGLEGHAVSMLIWALAGAYLIYLSLVARENYGISLIQISAGLMLILSGTCYLWARMVGVLSVNGQPHAATADYLLLAALILTGVSGLGCVIADNFRSGYLDRFNISRD